MNQDGSKNWLILYREAVLEPDPRKSRSRIIQAQRAIAHRARELWYGGAKETTERQKMDAASHLLRVLRAIGDEHS